MQSQPWLILRSGGGVWGHGVGEVALGFGGVGEVDAKGQIITKTGTHTCRRWSRLASAFRLALFPSKCLQVGGNQPFGKPKFNGGNWADCGMSGFRHAVQIPDIKRGANVMAACADVSAVNLSD